MRTNNNIAALVLTTLPLGLACATPAPVLASFSQPSSSGSMETSYSVQPSSPGMIRVDADLVVRPDQVCLPFAITAEAKDPAAALARAKAVVDSIAARTGATVRIDDVRSDVHDGLVRKISDGSTVGRVVVNGAVEASLGDGDAFARAAVAAALTSALWGLTHPAVVDETLELRTGTAEPGVKDLEQHRAKMLDSWASRITALSKSVGGDAVELTNCQAPQQVRIGGGTFEKVGLSLPISCAIAIKAKA